MFRYIFIFPKTYALSNFLKLCTFCYYTNIGRVAEDISILLKNRGQFIRGEDSLGEKDPTSHIIQPLTTTYTLCGIVHHLNQATNVCHNKYYMKEFENKMCEKFHFMY